jgi:hypothetical protein
LPSKWVKKIHKKTWNNFTFFFYNIEWLSFKLKYDIVKTIFWLSSPQLKKNQPLTGFKYYIKQKWIPKQTLLSSISQIALRHTKLSHRGYQSANEYFSSHTNYVTRDALTNYLFIYIFELKFDKNWGQDNCY